MNADIINGIYEALGTIFALNNCRVAMKHKQIRGVSMVTTAFWSSWGVWNLFYYPHLGQWFSFIGGIGVTCANIWWLFLMWRFK